MITTALKQALIGIAAVITAAASACAAGSSQVQVRVNFDHTAVYHDLPGDRYLEIEVVAPAEGLFRGPERRPPLNIALVIDKSGSMAEAGKLGFVKEAARSMLERLQYGDRFALVTYDDRVQVPLPSESFEDRTRARSVIDGLFPGGATNLGGGLTEGYRQVRRHFNPTGVNRVLLLSDGLANRGITSADELSRIAAGEGDGGVELTTFGVGLDFNEDLLAGLAESGRGTYYYIDRPSRIPELLAREFSTLQRLCAANVVITIEVQPEIVIGEILGYEYRRDGNRYQIQIGSLAGGERRRIMARIAPPRWSPGVHRIGQVELRYQPAGERNPVSSTQEVSLRWVSDRESALGSMNREVVERSAVSEANVARKKAAQRVDQGDVAGAEVILRESASQLQAAPVQSDAVRQELRENESYGRAINAPMSPAEKSAIQKEIKYDSYRTLQQK